MGVLIAENPVPSQIRIEFERDDAKPKQIKLVVKSNIGVYEEGPKRGKDGLEGGAPADLPEAGEKLMRALVTSLRQKGIVASRKAQPILPHGEEPPHQKSAFTLTATIETDKDDKTLRPVFDAAIADAEQQAGFNNYDRTTDAQGGKHAGKPWSRL